MGARRGWCALQYGVGWISDLEHCCLLVSHLPWGKGDR